MEYRVLGRTGLRVSTLGLGAGGFGAFGGLDEATSVRLAHTAFDGGINLIDTADFYSLGESELYTGKAIADRRDKIILATKSGLPMSENPLERGGSRLWITRAVESSLKRLGTDYIDIYQLHQPDLDTDLEETLDVMNDLVRAGKIRYYGVANSTARLISEGQLRAKLKNIVAPHTEQSSYSLFDRYPERELLPACHEYAMGFFAYSPLDGGWLTGKYRKGQDPERTARQRLQPAKYDMTTAENKSKLEKVEALAKLAHEFGVELSQMAIGFVLAHHAVSCALIGGSKVEHIQKHLDGQDVVLSDDVLDMIDGIIPPGEGSGSGHVVQANLANTELRRFRRKTAQDTTAAVGHRHIRTVVEEKR